MQTLQNVKSLFYTLHCNYKKNLDYKLPYSRDMLNDKFSLSEKAFIRPFPFNYSLYKINPSPRCLLYYLSLFYRDEKNEVVQ